MPNKHEALSLFRPWPSPKSQTRKSHLGEIFIHLKYFWKSPKGWEDENGFHFGEEPLFKRLRRQTIEPRHHQGSCK
jgi:hypothetical protein